VEEDKENVNKNMKGEQEEYGNASRIDNIELMQSY
jgi:hypothetical protein